MSRRYRLESGEPFAEGVARIARGRIDHALDELGGNTDSSPEDAVHGARKDLKKLRSLLRLVRDDLGGKVYRREMAVFRDAGRELAGVRDADVMLATLESLELPPAEAGPVRQRLEAHRLQTAAGTREHAAAAAAQLLTDARARVTDWPLEGVDFEPGLRRAYRSGRRDFRAARRDPSAENMHEWRKRVKDLWYQLSILEPAWPPVMSALGDEAHELSDRLGDDHDLAVLADWSGDPALEEPVRRRRETLQAEAFSYGARLYAEKPKAFTGRVEIWWGARSRAPHPAA